MITWRYFGLLKVKIFSNLSIVAEIDPTKMGLGQHRFYTREFRVHVSQYFLLFRYFFISKFDVPNRLGCLGYKYVPPSIVERFITRSISKPYFLPAIYFIVGGFAIFFLCEFFRVDQGHLTFEQLDMLISFCLPSKSELQLPGASLLLRSDLFKSYRIIFSL